MSPDNRHKTHEAKHVKGHEIEFKVMARRNRLLGEWVAEKLGMKGGDVQEYAKSVVRSDLEEPGEDDVFRKVMADLRAAHVTMAEKDVRVQMARLLETARDQIDAEKPADGQ